MNYDKASASPVERSNYAMKFDKQFAGDPSIQILSWRLKKTITLTNVVPLWFCVPVMCRQYSIYSGLGSHPKQLHNQRV